jgi:hypothetical protein
MPSLDSQHSALVLGDVVFGENNVGDLIRLKISRTTPTRAFAKRGSKEYGFVRFFPVNQMLTEYPEDTGFMTSKVYFEVSTPELEARYLRQRHIAFISGLSLQALTTETLRQMVKLAGDDLEATKKVSAATGVQ